MPPSPEPGGVPAEQWARRIEVESLLAQMLEQPEQDFFEQVEQLFGNIICAAHVYGIERLASAKRLRAPPFSNAVTTNGVVALHIWLFHLGGGARRKLLPPPIGRSAVVSNKSKAVYTLVQKEADKFRTAVKNFGRSTSSAQALLQLRSAPFNFSVLQFDRPPADASEGASPPPLAPKLLP